MPSAITTFSVQDGEIVSSGAGWVYAWREIGSRSVIYIGATALHPVARAEKHLRDPDPLIGRIRHDYPAVGGDLAQTLTVHAIALDPGCRRGLVKARVAWLVRESDLLSSRYCGVPPALPEESLSDEEEACARTLARSLA